MLRGEIRLVDLDPARAGEANKRRPAVLVSNDGANTTAAKLGRGVVTVVPITTNTDRVYPFQVLIPANASGLDRDSKAQAEQVRSVSVDRVTDLIGTVAPELMLEVDEALRLHLAI
jgi:mRNA interferase MazF